ncbi:MAG: Fibronectin type domain protein, partial [Bacteroidetes bacterium]|nr:Fibronectin type domain protein [Bacteroidota bacterium]
WNTVVDSAFVVSRVLTALHVYPSCLVMVPGEQVTLVTRAEDNAGEVFTLDNRHLSFFPTGMNINADATGLVTARDFGTGLLNIQLDTLHASIPYDLRGTDTSIVIDRMESLSPWDTTLTALQQGEVQITLSGDHGTPDASAMKIQYAFPDARASVVLNTSIPLSGRIDSVMLRVFGSGNADTIRFLVKDKDNQSFQVTPTSAISWTGEWRTVGVIMSRAIPLAGGTLDYPVTVTGLRIDLGRANLSGGTIAGTLLLDDLGAHYPLRTVAPQVLFDFESGVGGWLTPAQSNAAQLKGINIAASSLAQSADRAYQGSYCGKWTFVDDASSAVDWDIRMTRGTSSDLGSMLRGSYVGAWVYAKLDEDLFAPYLTSGKITDAGNKFNGFRLRGSNAALSGQSRTVYIDKLVTSALTVPTGFISFTAEWNAPLVRLHWAVNSEISINRYAVERGSATAFEEIMSQAGRGNLDTTMHYEVVDTPPSGAVVHYRIRQITNDGGQELSQTIVVNTTSNSVGPGGELPESYQLLQNFPNPFNPSTTFVFALPVDSHVRLVVYNTLGQAVAEVLNSVRRAGYHQQAWSPSLASGVYFYRMEANGVTDPYSRFLDTKAMVFVK